MNFRKQTQNPSDTMTTYFPNEETRESDVTLGLEDEDIFANMFLYGRDEDSDLNTSLAADIDK